MAFLDRLNKPVASIGETERRRARLLSALLAAQLFLSLLVTLLIFFTDHRPIETYLGLGTTLVLVGAFFLSRTRYYTLAALLAVGTLSGTVFISEAVRLDPGPLYFLVLGVLMGSLFFSRRDTILTMAIIMIGIGLLFWVSFPALALRDAVGAMFAVLCVGVLGSVAITIRQQDQVEIHRQSISLRQSEERFHLISYATNDVVWDWDILSGHVWRNKGIQRLFGFDEDQVRPEFDWWRELIHPDEREKIAMNIQAAIANGETFWSKEYRVQRADGSFVYVFDRAYIIHDESGKPVRMIGAVMDITARKQAEEVLRQESLHDPLTGLFNRRYMEEMLEREIRRAQRSQQQISIIMLDVDHFKKINDTFGHAAGDTVLHNLGTFLLKYVRGGDIACRYGGDEFILILPGATLDVARQRAEKLRLEAEKLKIGPLEKSAAGFTVSLGVAVFPDQGKDLGAILKAVDTALYAAKDAGRNRVFVAGEEKGEPEAT
ncbi:MAG TPA: diguanylate cyclase [Anaerolineales bacterium]|nr:diguanylate cyclase [Anaerolineales bacterium]